MQTFGMGLDNARVIITGKNATLSDFPQYVVSHLASCDQFYNVTSTLHGFPNFMVWQDSNLDLANYEPLPPKMIFDTVSPYMANMVDEELELFIPTLEKLIKFKDTLRITCHDNGFEVYTSFGGRNKLLLVTVMNMINTSLGGSDFKHWRKRDSLN